MNNNNTRIKISFFLAGVILMINLLQASIVIEHYTQHIHNHETLVAIDHSHCGSSCVHATKEMADEVCDGHFFNFMPQVEFESPDYFSQIPELPTVNALPTIVKRYHSSYNHLFTPRGPPALS